MWRFPTVHGIIRVVITVLSVGGSIIAPDRPDPEFLRAFRAAIGDYLEAHADDRLVFVIGGGAPARIYQQALRSASRDASASLLDWIGIRATHLNAMLVQAVFAPLSSPGIVTDPTGDIDFSGRILVAGGWKPGFSTDTDAVYLARRYGAEKVVNLSNIKKVYTDDPRTNPDAIALDSISWHDFRKMVGDEWSPGRNTPFDPVASRMAEESGITVICADGRNIDNTIAILEGRDAEGTVIGA